jgi:hypothetical protein
VKIVLFINSNQGGALAPVDLPFGYRVAAGHPYSKAFAENGRYFFPFLFLLQWFMTSLIVECTCLKVLFISLKKTARRELRTAMETQLVL